MVERIPKSDDVEVYYGGRDPHAMGLLSAYSFLSRVADSYVGDFEYFDDSTRLRVIAEWLDDMDDFIQRDLPNHKRLLGDSIQKDLRRIADRLEEYDAS